MGGNWSILGILNTKEGIISKISAWISIILDEPKFVLFIYMLLALYMLN